MSKKTHRKGFNFFRSYYDVYNELNKDDKVKFMDALLDRQFLGVKPEGLTGMSKFAYISQAHSIDSQVKGYEDKTKTKLLTTPTDGGCEPPTAQEKEKEKEKEKEQVQDVKIFSFRKSLYDLGLDKTIVDDFLKNRKLKRLANTETAYKNLLIELQKSQLDLLTLFNKIVSNGWGSFKNSWLEKEKSSAKKEKPIMLIDKMKREYGIK